MTFAYVFDVGPFRVRKYESVVIGLGTRVEVVSKEQKASLLDESTTCRWYTKVIDSEREYDIPCQSYKEVGDQPAAVYQSDSVFSLL